MREGGSNARPKNCVLALLRSSKGYFKGQEEERRNSSARMRTKHKRNAALDPSEGVKSREPVEKGRSLVNG